MTQPQLENKLKEFAQTYVRATLGGDDRALDTLQRIELELWAEINPSKEA